MEGLTFEGKSEGLVSRLNAMAEKFAIEGELVEVLLSRINTLDFSTLNKMTKFKSGSGSNDLFNEDGESKEVSEGSPYFTSIQLRSLDEKLERRRNLYTYAGDVYRVWYLGFTVPALMFTSSSSVVNGAWQEGYEPTWRRWITTSLSALAALMIALVSLLKYESVHTGFYQAANQCDVLHTEVEFLRKFETNSISSDKFDAAMKKIKEELDDNDVSEFQLFRYLL